MIIAFIALAVIALVFLFVYNARVSRKSARKHAENQVQAQQSPAASETVADTMSAEPEKRLAEEPADASARPTVTGKSRPLHSSELESDLAYREALRQFAGVTSKKEEDKTPVPVKPVPESDDAYREALRVMARNKK